MRTLVAWDDPNEGELLGLYLAAGENEASVCHSSDDLSARMEQGNWDAVLMSATFPQTIDEGFAIFRKVQENLPGMPIVLACRSTEMLKLTRFLNHGLRFYLVRDEAGDFVFLAISTLESAVEAARAEEGRKLASRLREEMDGVRRLQESIIPQGIKPPPGY